MLFLRKGSRLLQGQTDEIVNNRCAGCAGVGISLRGHHRDLRTAVQHLIGLSALGNDGARGKIGFFLAPGRHQAEIKEICFGRLALRTDEVRHIGLLNTGRQRDGYGLILCHRRGGFHGLINDLILHDLRGILLVRYLQSQAHILQHLLGLLRVKADEIRHHDLLGHVIVGKKPLKIRPYREQNRAGCQKKSSENQGLGQHGHLADIRLPEFLFLAFYLVGIQLCQELFRRRGTLYRVDIQGVHDGVADIPVNLDLLVERYQLVVRRPLHGILRCLPRHHLVEGGRGGVDVGPGALVAAALILLNRGKS